MICAVAYYLIERNLEGDAFYIAGGNNINSLREFQRVKFSSDLDTNEPGTYTLKIESKSGKGQKIDIQRKFVFTTFFDECGYLHRFKVKEAFDETLQKFINSPR